MILPTIIIIKKMRTMKPVPIHFVGTIAKNNKCALNNNDFNQHILK